VAAAFKATGFKLKGKKWFACAEGQVGEIRDINGDGLPEVIINESGNECHGMTGEGYSLMSKQSNGTWKLMSGSTGIPLFLKSQGASGWPDLQVGGPAFASLELARIFDKFYRVPRHDPWQKGGTGLGLSLGKKLIEQANGSIAVVSDQGWTTFTPPTLLNLLGYFLHMMTHSPMGGSYHDAGREFFIALVCRGKTAGMEGAT
jgi:hypothetical protein